MIRKTWKYKIGEKVTIRKNFESKPYLENWWSKKHERLIDTVCIVVDYAGVEYLDYYVMSLYDYEKFKESRKEYPDFNKTQHFTESSIVNLRKSKIKRLLNENL